MNIDRATSSLVTLKHLKRKPKSKPSRLLPCPFCGGEPESKEVKFTGCGVFQWEVKCWRCRCADAHSYKSQQEAEAQWNRRFDPTPSDYAIQLAVMEECTCGGGGPNDPHTCPACKMYHRLVTE